MIGVAAMAKIPIGYLPEEQSDIVTAEVEIMDCPDSWEDQLETSTIDMDIDNLIPASVVGKQKTWIA